MIGIAIEVGSVVCWSSKKAMSSSEEDNSH
jgi:hypothetical protein